MKANIGDRIVVEGRTDNTARRDGLIVSVHGADGGPPFEVRWSDTGHTTLVFPGPDAHIVHLTNTGSG